MTQSGGGVGVVVGWGGVGWDGRSTYYDNDTKKQETNLKNKLI
jgi:hypothetical protein